MIRHTKRVERDWPSSTNKNIANNYNFKINNTHQYIPPAPSPPQQSRPSSPPRRPLQKGEKDKMEMIQSIAIYFQLLMGTKQSLSYKPPSLKRENWKEKKVSRAGQKVDHGKYSILVGNLSSEEIEQYGVNFHNLAEFQKYVQFFEWRSREDCIVNSKYLNYELSKEFCNTNYSAKVYIEHIPVRLSDIQDIPYPENLYVLFSALDGFEKLYHSVGYFKINEDLICMDKDGKVKVWLNPDLSKCYTFGGNFSDQVNNYRKSETLQQAMVGQIVKIIETNTTEDIEPSETLTEFIWHNHKSRGLGFKLMKQEVINYAQKYGTDIPNYFDSVIGIFEQAHDNDEAEAHNLINHPIEYQDDKSQARVGHQYYEQEQFHSSPEVESVKVYNHIPFRESSEQYGGSVDNHRGKVKAMNIIEERPYSSTIPLQIGSINNTNLKVKFNYHNHLALSPQSYINPISPIMQLASRNIEKASKPPTFDERKYFCEEQYSDPKLQLSSSLQNLLSSNKLFYSDSTKTYELDEEIAHDMIRYLSAQG